LKEIKSKDPDQVVVMITAYGSVETAVQAMRMGAHDYLTKPFKNEDVLRVLRNGLRHRRLLSENRSLRRALQGHARFGELVGKSKAMQDLYRMIAQVAPSRSSGRGPASPCSAPPAPRNARGPGGRGAA